MYLAWSYNTTFYAGDNLGEPSGFSCVGCRLPMILYDATTLY
jgi:hypothetical protein